MEEWQPTFTYHGFRFVELTGFREKPSLSDFEGQVIYDEMETTRAGHSRKKIMDKCISLFCIYDWVLCNTIHKGMNNNFSGIQYHQVF